MANNAVVKRVKGDTGSSGGDLTTALKDTNYTATSTDNFIIATSGITVTLEGSPTEGRHLWVKNIGETLVNVTGNGNIIEDSVILNISSGTTVHVAYSSPQWYVI